MISERLGHSTAAFTLQTYTHVIPGMDALAADTVAHLILGQPDVEADGSILGSIEGLEEPEEPLTAVRQQVSGSSFRSGGRI